MDISDLVRAAAYARLVADVETVTAIKVLPNDGYRLCRHGVKIVTDPPAWDDDVTTIRLTEQVHTLAPGEACEVLPREEHERL